MLNIRLAKEEDYEELLKMIKQIHNQHVEYRPDIFKAADIPMTKEEYNKIINNDNIIIGLVDNEIIGYMYFLIRQNTCSILVDRKFMFLDSIVILDGKQANGYGKEFIEYLKKYAKDKQCDSIELNVNIKNKEAINFYLNNGFNERERRMEIKI